jgi:hypothetical protein
MPIVIGRSWRSEPPEGETECQYGQYGWPGRAVRDAPSLAMNKFAATFVVSAAVVVVTVAFIVVPEGDRATQIVFGLLGFTVGTAVGLALIALWGLTPWARRYHWRVHCGPLSQDPSHYGDHGFAPNHTGLWLKSRHWHTVTNLRCTVTDPLRQEWASPLWRPTDRPALLLKPGESAGGFSYPGEFGAPWPMPGKYRVRWEMDAEERTKPIVLARGSWTVE